MHRRCIGMGRVGFELGDILGLKHGQGRTNDDQGAGWIHGGRWVGETDPTPSLRLLHPGKLIIPFHLTPRAAKA